MPPSVFVIRVKQPTTITYAHCDHFDRTYTATLLSTGATNLLSGNNATFETGIGSWVADTATAPSSRATLFTGGISHSGSNSMRADNNNGSGNCRVQYPTGLIAASPGDYHWFQCWGYDQDNLWGRTAMLEYLDSGGTILASSGTVYPGVSAGVWRALSHWNRTPAPAGTAWVRPVFFFSATTGGYYTMVDDAEVRTAVVDQSATLDSPWVVQSGTWKVISPGKADASAVSGGTPPFGLSSRAFARYPVGVGAIDLSVAWASLGSASRSVVFAYDPSSDTGFTVDYDGGTTISLTQHNGSTATTLATATVTPFTSATFEIVYNTTANTIVVKQNGTTIISASSPITVTLGTNLLTTNQSGLETGATTGWAAQPDPTYGTVYTVISADTAHANTGTYSLKVSTSAAIDRYFATPAGTSGFAVTPGSAYKVLANVWRSDLSDASRLYFDVRWYNSSGTLLSTSTGSAIYINPRESWVAVNFGTFTAPAGAAYGQLYGYTSSANNLTITYWLDDIAVQLATTGPAILGGWAGLMTDAANADQWDEFCWTML